MTNANNVVHTGTTQSFRAFLQVGTAAFFVRTVHSMASFNDVLATNTVMPTAVCSVAKWRETLSSTDRQQFDAASSNPSIQHAVLWRTMRALGYEPSATAVQRHRTGGCKCPSLTN